MPNALYTFDQILLLASDLAGNPGLIIVPTDDTESRLSRLAKLFLHHCFLTYDWEFNLTINQAWSVAVNGFSVSLSSMTRYAKMDQIMITSPAGEQPLALEEMPWKDINFNIQQNNSTTPVITGLPRYFHVTPDQSAFVIWPIAQKAYSGLLSYYQMPNVASYTTGSTLPFEDSNALVTALASIVQRWDKENRSELMAQVASQFYADYRAKHEDAGRANTRKWRWSNNFLKKSSN